MALEKNAYNLNGNSLQFEKVQKDLERAKLFALNFSGR
jgi:hypothetical protein